MSEGTPSSVLLAAADRIRDLAADTTRPRPNGHDWGLLGEEDGWDPSWSAVVCCAGYGGEDVVATDIKVGDARWIAALSPAVAPHLARILLTSAARWEISERRAAAFEGAPLDSWVDESDRDALEVARAILGSGVDTP